MLLLLPYLLLSISRCLILIKESKCRAFAVDENFTYIMLGFTLFNTHILWGLIFSTLLVAQVYDSEVRLNREPR
jgi:hypothetical protein